MILTLPRAANSFLELAGCSRVYVSGAIVSLQAVTVHCYKYLTRTAEITILEITANK